MITMPKSRDSMYEDPDERHILNIDNNEDAVALLERLPSLTVMHTAREKMMEKMVQRFATERDFYYEDAQVPDYVIRNIAWKSTGEFVRAISEALLKDPNLFQEIES